MRARLAAAIASSLLVPTLGACSASQGNELTGGGGAGASAGTSSSSNGTGVGGFQPGTGGNGTGGVGQFDGCHNVDVLFAIDDSGSMGDKQAALAQAFPGLVDTM